MDPRAVAEWHLGGSPGVVRNTVEHAGVQKVAPTVNKGVQAVHRDYDR